MALFRAPTLTRSRGFPASTAGAFSIAFAIIKKRREPWGSPFFSLLHDGFRYKGRGIDPQAVGHELNVRASKSDHYLSQGRNLGLHSAKVFPLQGKTIFFTG